MFNFKETTQATKAIGNKDDVINTFLQSFLSYEVPVGAMPAVGLNTSEGTKYYAIQVKEMTEEEVKNHMQQMQSMMAAAR